MRDKASEDIHMRISPQTKALLQHAAALSGHTSLSGFISSVATQEARKIIRREEVTLLSNEGMDYVIDLLNNPPLPNEKLKELMKDTLKKKSDKKNHSE